MNLNARLQFLKNRNIAEISIKELMSMPAWNKYKRSEFVKSHELIGETLEYLDHKIKKSAYHPQFNKDNDKEYAIIEVVKHDRNGMSPMTVVNNSGTVLDWLRKINSILIPDKILFFRFTYDETAKAPKPKWGIEYTHEDKSGDEIPGLEYNEPDL